MSVQIHAIGKTVTCQVGNSFDTYGYLPQAQVVVLGSRVRHDLVDGAQMKSAFYLIKIVGENRVGRAIDPRCNPKKLGKNVETDLYCTVAMGYGGEGQPTTLEDAVKAIF